MNCQHTNQVKVELLWLKGILESVPPAHMPAADPESVKNHCVRERKPCYSGLLATVTKSKNLSPIRFAFLTEVIFEIQSKLKERIKNRKYYLFFLRRQFTPFIA